jgi:hypothetical protein
VRSPEDVSDCLTDFTAVGTAEAAKYVLVAFVARQRLALRLVRKPSTALLGAIP